LSRLPEHRQKKIGREAAGEVRADREKNAIIFEEKSNLPNFGTLSSFFTLCSSTLALAALEPNGKFGFKAKGSARLKKSCRLADDIDIM